MLIIYIYIYIYILYRIQTTDVARLDDKNTIIKTDILDSLNDGIELPARLDIIPVIHNNNCRYLPGWNPNLPTGGDLCTVILQYTTTQTGTAIFTYTTTWGTKVIFCFGNLRKNR